jgi:hypothetical protein
MVSWDAHVWIALHPTHSYTCHSCTHLAPLPLAMHAELHAAHWPTTPTLSLTLHSIPQFVGHSYWLHLPMRVTAATTCTRTQYTYGDITAPHRVPLPPAGQNYRLPTSLQGDLVHWRYHHTTQGPPATCWVELQAAHQLAAGDLVHPRHLPLAPHKGPDHPLCLCWPVNQHWTQFAYICLLDQPLLPRSASNMCCNRLWLCGIFFLGT